MPTFVDKHTLAADFFDAGVLRFGEFTLASGAHSPVYVDATQLVLSRRTAASIEHDLVAHIHAHYPHARAIGGPPLGVVPALSGLIQYAYAFTWRMENKLDLAGFVVRTTMNDHGRKERIEGPISPQTHRDVILLDDVGTTGKTLLTAADAMSEAGYTVIAAYCLVDRWEGAAAALESRKIPFHALTTLTAILDAAETRYHTMDHTTDCARRGHGAVECTCVRGQLGSDLVSCGRRI